MSVFLMIEAQEQAAYWQRRALAAEAALAAAARQGGDVQQAPAESPQSGGDSRNAERRSA